MPSRVESGHYRVGRIEPKPKPNGPRPRQTGTYGVIKGANIADNGHQEWSHICEGVVKRSRWCAFRIGPGDNGTGTRTDLLKAFDSKTDAVDWVMQRYGNQFDATY
jgi:hypothetical protein